MSEQTDSSYLPHIPPQIQGNIHSFLDDILSAFAGEVLSMVITGSCVTGDYLPGKSDVNSLLVLTEITPPVLDALVSMGRRYGKKGLSSPLIMTSEYITRSLDVFPIEFLDIKLVHATIYGRDFFSDLPIKKSLLRLQCERDLKSKLIHLHQGYVSSSGRQRVLTQLLVDAYPGFFPLFRAMLSIVQINRTPPLQKPDVLSHIESVFGIRLDALREIRGPQAKRLFRTGRRDAKDLFFEVYRIAHELSLAMDRLAG